MRRSDKIYAGEKENVTKGVNNPASRHARRLRRRHWSNFYVDFYDRALAPLEHAYQSLSLTTRQTIRVAISLYALLYIFLTVPFRVAFYYDPIGKTESVNTHSWTSELSVYAVMDAVADTIGLIEFLRFYRRTRFESFNSRKTTSWKDSLFQTARIVRTPSFDGKRQGENKWTLASIKCLALTNGKSAGAFVSKRDAARTQNLEFALEVVALLPLEVLPYALGEFNTLHLLRLTKLCRLYRLQLCLARVASIYSDRVWAQHLSSVGINNLARNIGLCVGLWYWVACGYMFLAHAQCGITFEACAEEGQTSWVILDRLYGATVARKYARTLYWASRTLFLLGFDELAPVSDVETMYVILVTIMGALFTSSLLASFLFIFRVWNVRYATFATHVDNAREYMKSQNIPRSLRHQVVEYFTYSWNTHHSLDSEEALHLMPRHLQAKVVYTLKTRRIKQVCFIAKESVEFINLLAVALVRREYSPTDQIIEPKLNAQMFFIIRGCVVLSAFNGSNSKECQAGNFFADVSLLFPEKFDEKALAKTFCELYVLSKDKFDEAMTEYYRDTEAQVRARMMAALEKALAQLLKTKKLLGIRGSGGSSNNFMVEGQHLPTSKRAIRWSLPGSVFQAHWDAARLLAVVFVAFEVPYFVVFISMAEEQQVFGERPELNLRFLLALLVEIFFGMDLILRSRFLAHLDPVVMIAVEDPDLIFAAYKENGFYLDLMAWLPVATVLEALTTASMRRYSQFFQLLRLFRLREVRGLLWNICDYYSVSSKAHLVTSLVLGVSFMVHVIGCIWYEMAWVPDRGASERADKAVLWSLSSSECLRQATQFGNCSWVVFDCYAQIGDVFPVESPASMYDAPFAYLRAMYWAISTLTTVGYGDITAYSTGESFFASIWIFVGGILNFAVIGAMSSIISNATAPHRAHIERLNALNGILGRMNISEKLSTEIRRFYHMEFARHKRTFESQLLANLPDQLCYEISSLLHSDAVKSVELFDSASVEFLKEVTGKFRHRDYQNGDSICLEGDLCREFFVFLRGSRVNVFFRSRKVPVRALHGGDCYGASEFLLRRAHPATLTAASHVHASVMTREEFDGIQRKFDDDLKDMKEEAQTFCKEQHEVMLRVAHNLEKLKLQPHLLSTPTLFQQGETTLSAASDTVWKVYATRSTFTSLWHTVIAFWSAYNAVFIVFRICFHSHLHFSSGTNTAIWMTDVGCDLCFALDIYLRLFYLGCPDVGVENLVDRKEIDKRYRRSSSLRWDLVACLPIYTPFASGSLVASLCRLPRLVRSLDLWTYLDDGIVQLQQHFASHNVSAYLSPTKLVIIFVLVAHYAGSIFFWISERECEQIENCWMAQDDLLLERRRSVSMLYVTSMYWAITTLLLAGPGNMVPRGAAGTLWTCFTCLCCTFIVGHIVGEISDLIQELGKETKQYKSRVASFDGFAKKHELPRSLRSRVEFFFREQLKHVDGDDLYNSLKDLSANLRLRLMLEVYGDLIMLLPISRFLTSSQINNLALRLKAELFIPGDNILVEGTLGSRLCMLRRGQAAVFWTSSVTSVAVLMEGSAFGEVAFFLPGQQRLASVRATTSCEVLYVAKHDWQELWTKTNDLSDAQVQKHARCAILHWVHTRLGRYRQLSLHAASKVKQQLAARHEPPRLLTATTAATGAAKAKRKLSASLSRRDSKFMVTASVSTCKVEVSGRQLLERKAEYLQARTDEYVKRFVPAIELLHTHHRASSLRSSQSFRSSSKEHGRTSGLSGFYRSMTGDITTPVVHNRISDIHALQFIVAVDPGDKRVCDALSDRQLRSLETECWTRCKLLAAAQYKSTKLLEQVAPSETIVIRTCANHQTTLHPAIRLRRVRSFHYDEHADRQQGVQRVVAAAMKAAIRSSGTPKVAAKWKTLAVATTPTLRLALQTTRPRRRLCDVVEQYQRRRRSESAASLGRMVRCRSLPHFEREFYEEACRQENNHALTSTRTGLDFELLQRYQHPHYAAQRLLHRLRTWKDLNQASIGRHVSSRDQIVIGTRNRQSAVLRPSLQVSSRRASLAGERVFKTIVNSLKQMGDIWDLVMLVIAVYHLEVTTFKVCFSFDLTALADGVLYGWSGLEIFLDLLCFLDVGYKFKHRSKPQEASASIRQSESRPPLTDDTALRADVLAILPLELFLAVTDVRIPLAFMPSTGTAGASWWTTRWLLRTNRLLFVRRIEPLSDKLLQFLIHDRKVAVNEALLSFVQGLTTYLTMGHLLACTWCLINQLLGLLSTDANPASVSLTQKYLAALLFAMECISTLFYGDILSMRPADVVVEIGITLWSIYIYGALVGAQAELFDAQARREVAFEQTLGQLQHYLVLNGVPKGTKRQVKAYYARIWHRRMGEEEFAAVESVTRALYEDVLLTTVGSFAVQVPAFRALDDQFLRALLVCLQYVVCSESEEVFVVGDMDRSMYFIAQGCVVVKRGSSESTRDRGEFFGELSLLYGIPRLETCVTRTVTELYRLDHEPYERLLLEFPEYRARNKVSWTTVSERDPMNSLDMVEHSYIARSVMELLSKLNKVDPLEAKDLVLRSREGARRCLRVAMEVVTARREAEDDVVHSFHSRSSSSTPRKDELEHRSESENPTEAAVEELPDSIQTTRTKTLEKRRSTILLRHQDRPRPASTQPRRWSSAAIPNSTMKS